MKYYFNRITKALQYSCYRFRYYSACVTLILQNSVCSLNYCNKKIKEALMRFFYWSGRRGSDSLPPPWQGGALPDELRPHIAQCHMKLNCAWCLRSESNQRHEDFQSSALPTELQRHMGTGQCPWRPRTGSNRRPPA